MAVKKVTRLVLHLDNGKTAQINLPEPINNTLTDEDSGNTLYDAVTPAVKAVYATDLEYRVMSIDYIIISTNTNTIASGDT